MTARDPFRRPPMIDVPWGERERWWARTTQRLTEARKWREVETFADLCELCAQFCEGRLDRTPGHMGARAEETVRIGDELAHANRNGFLTCGSQPGEDDAGHQQQAVVEGWASQGTVERLRRLVAGTRDACYVTVYDPRWGDESLLWDRLGQPDWDSPEPPERTSEVNDSWSASCGDGECGWIGSDWATGDEAAAELRRHEESGHVNYTAGNVPPGTTITLPEEPYVLDVVDTEQLPGGMVRLNGVGESHVMAASWPIERYTQERADLETGLVLDEQQRHFGDGWCSDVFRGGQG